MGAEMIFYQFSRSKVEKCDFGHFLGLYAPDKLPTGRRLREMMGTLMFGIEGPIENRHRFGEFASGLPMGLGIRNNGFRTLFDPLWLLGYYSPMRLSALTGPRKFFVGTPRLLA